MIESVRPSPVMAKNLQTMRERRELVFDRFKILSESDQWSRLQPNTWSAGEHLVHLNRTLTTFVATLKVLTPLLYPMAWFNRSRTYELTMRDYFDPATYRPIKTAAFLDPKQRREPIEKIEADFSRAMTAAQNYFLSLDEGIAGNIKLPYPPSKSTISVLQLTFSLGYHERHHFRAMACHVPALKIAGVTD